MKIGEKRKKRLIAQAKKIKESSEVQFFQMSAVIFDKSIISVGYNKNKTHTLARKYFQHGTVHAEIDALISCPYGKANGSSVFVYRELQDGSLGLAKPCPLCVQVLNEFGVKRAFWTTDEQEVECELIETLMEEIDFDRAFLFNKFKKTFQQD